MVKYLIILSLLIVSCSPAKRLHRLIKNNPELRTLKDTVTIKDTIRFQTERVFYDSVFLMSSDTVIIQKDNLTIRTYINGDTVYISGECDSIIKYVPYEVEVITDKIVYKESDFESIIKNWIVISIIILMLIFLPKQIRKLLKK
jgi:hypothetical protein